MIIKNNFKKDLSITPNALTLYLSISAEAHRLYCYIATKIKFKSNCLSLVLLGDDLRLNGDAA